MRIRIGRRTHEVVNAGAKRDGRRRAGIRRADRDCLVEAEAIEGRIGLLNVLEHRRAGSDTISVGCRAAVSIALKNELVADGDSTNVLRTVLGDGRGQDVHLTLIDCLDRVV